MARNDFLEKVTFEKHFPERIGLSLLGLEKSTFCLQINYKDSICA